MNWYKTGIYSFLESITSKIFVLKSSGNKNGSSNMLADEFIMCLAGNCKTQGVIGGEIREKEPWKHSGAVPDARGHC